MLIIKLNVKIKIYVKKIHKLLDTFALFLELYINFNVSNL